MLGEEGECQHSISQGKLRGGKGDRPAEDVVVAVARPERQRSPATLGELAHESLDDVAVVRLSGSSIAVTGAV